MPVTDQQTNSAKTSAKSGLYRSLLLCFVAMLVVGMSFAGVASAQTTDSLEPNDDRDSATDVGSGASYDNLSIDSDTDEDYFAVQADAGDTINADIFFEDANGDIDLELQDSNGNYLASSISTNDDESISYTVEESGTYYIHVYPWSGAPNSYDIDVTTNGTATDDDDQIDDDQIEDGADLRSISFGESAEGTIDTSDPTIQEILHEPVTFTGESGQVVDISMTSETGDTYLILQDPDGEYVTFDDDSGDGLNSLIEGHELQQTGEYTIIATSFSGDETFNYTLTLEESDTQSTGDRLEPNDDRDSATDLGSGGSYDNLSIDSDTDEDYFAVQADAGDTINADIFFEDDNGDIDLELQDSNGNYLASSISTNDDESISYTVEESGTYYIQVYPWSGAPNDYGIDVSTDGESTDDDDDQIEDGADLRSISIGETAEGTIDTLDPTIEGYYHEPVSFYGQEGTNVDISMTSETGDSYLVLRGPDSEYLTFDDDGGDGLNAEISDYELPQSGNYTIIATSFDGSSTFDYELTVTSTGSNTEEPVQTNEDLSLSANSSATAGGDMRVDFTLENTGSEDQAVILQAGNGVDQLGAGYSISDHSDDGGEWRDDTGGLLYDSLSGEVNPSVTIDVPEDAEGEQYMTVVAESDQGNVSTTVVLNLDDIGIVQAADTNDDGELSDSEILAAIDAWRTDSTIEGTDTTVSDEEIINLITTWRSEGN